jgi:hypothetical protein
VAEGQIQRQFRRCNRIDVCIIEAMGLAPVHETAKHGGLGVWDARRLRSWRAVGSLTIWVCGNWHLD